MKVPIEIIISNMIKERQRKEKEDESRRIQLPVPTPLGREEDFASSQEDVEEQRGVVIIDIFGDEEE